MAFKNNALSFSRVNRWESCKLSFKLHYIDKLESKPGMPLRFGNAVHAGLEDLVNEALENCNGEEIELNTEDALRHMNKKLEECGITDLAVFSEGQQIARDFVTFTKSIDPKDIVGVELPFDFEVEGFKVRGFIDLVTKVNEDTIAVIDYKSNRMLYSGEDLQWSLQMLIYAHAIKLQFPWAKNVVAKYHMLRHNIYQYAEIRDDMIETAMAYLGSIGRQTENEKDFPPTLSSYCSWCDHKQHCPSYKDALAGNIDFDEKVNFSSFKEISDERERLASYIRVLDGHKKRLDARIKNDLEVNKDLIGNTHRYYMAKTEKYAYHVKPALKIISDHTGISQKDLVNDVLTVDNAALKKVLKKLEGELGKESVELIKVELEANADLKTGQRLQVTKIKKGG